MLRFRFGLWLRPSQATRGCSKPDYYLDMDRVSLSIAIGTLTATAGGGSLAIAAVEHDPGTSFSDNGWFVLGACLIGLGLISILWPLVAIVRDFIQHTRSPLDISFDHNDPICFQRRTMIELPDLQIRLKVHNKSRANLENLKARFTDLPTPYRHTVRIMHDNDPFCVRSNLGVDCAPGDDVYFDVIWKPLGSYQIWYQYADDDLIHTQDENPVPMMLQEIELEFIWRWRGSDDAAVPVKVRFTVQPIDEFECVLVPVPSAQRSRILRRRLAEVSN